MGASQHDRHKQVRCGLEGMGGGPNLTLGFDLRGVALVVA